MVKTFIFIFVLVSLLGFAMFLLRSLGALDERADFPNEGKLLQNQASPDKRISNVSFVIGFAPEVVCFSKLGSDPRLIYNASPYANRALEVLLKYLEEGYTIFLFVGKSQYYIEKFDHTDIYFDELPRSRCEHVTTAFSMTFRAPTNRFTYSRYSGFIDF